MSNMRNKILVTALGLATFAGASQAALQAVDPGPYTAATGFFPQWYEDTNALTLDLCLSNAVSANGPLCTLLPNPGIFDPLQPIVFPVNFPDESFYFTADANVVGQGIDLLYISAIEAAFAAGPPVPGDQVTFARIRIRADFDVTVPTPGVYRITHPFGVKEFSVDAPGRRVINDTVDIGIGAPGDFTGALGGQIGPFLVAAAAPGGAPLPFIQGLDPETGLSTGEEFIGDPNVLQFVTGGQNGVNEVRVERIANLGGAPTGDIDVASDQFFLSGRVFVPGVTQTPTDVAVDRASYSRTVDPVTLAVTTRIDGFATSTPTAGVCFRETLDLVGGTDPCLITMTGDGAGQFYGQDPDAPRVPPFIVVTATDTVAGTAPTTVAQALGDVVKVSRAEYQQNTGLLIVNATSSDEAAPPKLTVVGFDGATFTPVPGTIAEQRLQVDLGLGATAPEPPAFVTVVSSGGGRDTEPVQVVAVGAVNTPPVAVDDTATTAEDTPVTIPVLANDTDADGDVLAVTGVSGAVGGSASTDGATVTFTPALNFNGTGSFAYSISDGNGGTASANVTVTVTPVNDAPSAVNDSATTAANTAVTIPVLANDSDVDGDVLTVTAVANVVGGGAVINGGTTVTFTPNAGVTAGSFTYTVSDTGGLTATATVNVNVQAGVDYTIARFRVPGNGRVGRALSAVSVNIANVTGTAPRPATLVGEQNGITVYTQTLQVSDPPGGGTSQFAFPAYTPTTTGNINWTLTLQDDNPDTATGTTSVPR